MPESLIFHREHGNNQSSTLQGVHDRESYIRIRIDKRADAVLWLKENFACDAELKEILTEACEWMEARKKYIRGDRAMLGLVWKYHRYGTMASLLEIILPYLPEFLLKTLLWLVRKNYI